MAWEMVESPGGNRSPVGPERRLRREMSQLSAGGPGLG